MNGQAFKMTLAQFKEALIEMGYKVLSEGDNGIISRKRNKSITVECWDDYTNIFYENYNSRNYSYKYYQHGVKNFAKALANIMKFERKMGR